MRTKADYEAALNEPWRNIAPDRSQQKVNKSTSGRRTGTTTTVTPKAKSSGEKAGEAMAAARGRKKETVKAGGWASELKL